MRDEPLASKIMEAVAKAVKIPVTVKMRTGWNHENLNAPKLAKIAEDVGIKLVTVHGRTRCQMYDGKANWEFVRQVKDAIKIPVIVNGDIKDSASAKIALEMSGADGVMVGRACYGKPWLIHQISQEIKGEIFDQMPSILEQKEIVLNHFDEMIDHYGSETAVSLARKHIGWYSGGLRSSAEFRARINITRDINQIKQEINNFYDSQL